MKLFRRARTPKCTEERPSPESAAALPASASEHKDEASISGFVARSRQALEDKEEITREEWRKKKAWILSDNEGTAHPLLYLSLDILESPGLLTGILAFATAIGAVAVGLIQFGYRCRVTKDLHPADYISLLTASVTHTSQNSIGLLALAMLFGTLGIWAMNSAQHRISSSITERPRLKKREPGQRLWYGISWIALVAQIAALACAVCQLHTLCGSVQAIELGASGLALLHIGTLSKLPRLGYRVTTVLSIVFLVIALVMLAFGPKTPESDFPWTLPPSILHLCIGALWAEVALEGLVNRFLAQPSDSANAHDRTSETPEVPESKEPDGDKENSSNNATTKTCSAWRLGSILLDHLRKQMHRRATQTKTCSAWWLRDLYVDLTALAFLAVVAVGTGYGIGLFIETLPQSGS